MRWLLFFLINGLCFSNTHFAMDSTSVDFEKFEMLPSDLKKIIFTQAKQTEETSYYPTLETFVSFQPKPVKKTHSPNFIPWRIGYASDNPEIQSQLESKNDFIISHWDAKQKKGIPICSTPWAAIRVAGPNHKNLALLDHKALYIDREHGYFDKNDPLKYEIFDYDFSILLHPEKECFIAEKNNEKKLYICNEETKTWNQEIFPPLKKPIIFGPKNLVLLKQILESPSIDHLSCEVENYELYDLDTKKVYDRLSDFTFITHIPQEVLEHFVKESLFAKTHPLLVESFLENPHYEISKFCAHYFPEQSDIFLFSFMLNCKHKDMIYVQEKPVYFMLYNIEKKQLIYLGKGINSSLCPSTDVKKIDQQPYRIAIDSMLGKVGYFDNVVNPTTLANRFYLEKINQTTLTNQLIALNLISKTWEWLQLENPDESTGKQILATLKNKELFINPYKLIWQTTTQEYGNLFKNVYEKLRNTSE